MTLSSEVDDAINIITFHDVEHQIKVTNVGFDKVIVGFVLNILQVRQITGVSELIHVVNVVLEVLVDEQPYHMAADETGPAGDDNVLHIVIDFSNYEYKL